MDAIKSRTTSVSVVLLLIVFAVGCGDTGTVRGDDELRAGLAVETADLVHASTIRELAAHSDLVVVAEVTKVTSGRVAGVEKDPYSGLAFNNVQLSVTEVLRGAPASRLDSLVVEVVAKSGDESVAVLNGQMPLSTGDTGVFFLIRSGGAENAGWVPTNSQSMMIPGSLAFGSAPSRDPASLIVDPSRRPAAVLELVPDLSTVALSALVERVRAELV